MIKVIDSIKNVVVPYVLTMFPDKTSQAWKFEYIPARARILWVFENESELIHLAQITTLFKASGCTVEEVFIPYLPYGRQDKMVDNKATFALNTFSRMLPLATGGAPVKVVDPHGYTYEKYRIIDATQFILKSYIKSKAELVIYPDEGAYNRYHKLLDLPYVVFEKDREASTGKILSLNPKQPIPKVSNVLVVDDLCDGGATFLMLGKALKTVDHTMNLNLYVTHGIFSLGFHMLDSYYNNIYTTNSYTNKCKNQFDVHNL